MDPLLLIAIGAGALWLLVSLIRLARRRAQPGPAAPRAPSSPGSAPKPGALETGVLTGLLGGSVKDAAIADYALRRAEEVSGKQRTAADVSFAAGLESTLGRDPDPPAPGGAK